MKLRIRSLETKETLRIDLPDPCTLQHLQHAISLNHPSQHLSPSSFHLSLNRKDEIDASSPHDSLRSLGIISGDLLFYSLDPYAFSEPSGLAQSQTLGSRLQNQHTTQEEGFPIEGSQVPEAHITNRGVLPMAFDGSEAFGMERVESEMRAPLDDSGQEGGNLDFAGSDGVDFARSLCTDNARGKGFSVPVFLRKALKEEVHDDGGDHKLLVIAIHSVLLESGFVAFDPLSGSTFERFHLSEFWPSAAFCMSLCYTLPQLANSESGFQTVELKFHDLGKFITVYGYLASGGSGVCRVCLDERRFLPSLTSLWKQPSCFHGGLDLNVTPDASYGCEVFEFWRIVKDGLALPLLISLCERCGLGYPPCLMRLPMDIKLKILKCLPGNCIAKMGCVSSEFRSLAGRDELWKLKCLEEFGLEIEYEGFVWKQFFSNQWCAQRAISASSPTHWCSRNIPPCLPYPIIPSRGDRWGRRRTSFHTHCFLHPDDSYEFNMQF